ncbi:uncharacterized protein LOC116852643 isoform X2 [Odontomachus brunneus]|uniref:uncharacterized protein LOC116852643 isoform X2 n=1 Tax=Odontomachus brunneus TaxID=486640 RepID=UPI0013F28B25|nr:uncharacterized protein LOC116852643 isoform X2 [Odontomachus brunneus]
MNPTRSTNLRRGEESSTRNENDRLIVKLRNEDEKLRRRREWMRQQELERQHEKLKQQMILNYERKRAETMKSKRTSSHHSRSKSSSKSPSYDRHRERSSSRLSKSETLFKKLDGSTNGVVPLFKGPEGTQISSTELRRIKVDIRRNIPAKGPITTELQRDILNPEDVILKRREGNYREDVL